MFAWLSKLKNDDKKISLNKYKIIVRIIPRNPKIISNFQIKDFWGIYVGSTNNMVLFFLHGVIGWLFFSWYVCLFFIIIFLLLRFESNIFLPFLKNY